MMNAACLLVWTSLLLLIHAVVVVQQCDAHSDTFRQVTFGRTNKYSQQNLNSNDEPSSPVLILDVDNTLYSEQQVRQSTGMGVEEQIVKNTHDFCQRHLDMSPEQADNLYREYGSTIEGIRSLLLTNQAPVDHVKHILDRFYHEVYDPIDTTVLVESTTSNHGHSDSTGYSHSSHHGGSLLRSLLHSSRLPIYLASNSPSWHVHKVLQHLGLDAVQWAGILTPDTTSTCHHLYPTKFHPEIFYLSLLQKHPNRRMILLDNSALNLKLAADEMGMEGIQVSPENNLEKALAMSLGHVESNRDKYRFSEIRYLAAKNLVDAQSIHAPTWQQLAHHLAEVLSNDGILRVVDLGAGILSMLELVLMGNSSGEIAPLEFLLESRDVSVQGIKYYAYEPNLDLFLGCRATLARLGFVSLPSNIGSEAIEGNEHVFRHPQKNVTVYLRMRDFRQDVNSTNNNKNDLPPQLIVGCCFADLMDPQELVQSLHRFLQTWKKGVDSNSHQVLAYFPITFCGTTQFLPPKPFDTSKGIPSDTFAFRLYSNALEQRQGHNLDPNRLVEAMHDYGNVLLAKGPSNWNINPIQNAYLWNTMMYFFGTVGAPEILANGWDAVGWIQRAKATEPTIIVSNVDLLFCLGGQKAQSKAPQEDHLTQNDDVLTVEEIQFVAPYQVTTTKRVLNTRHASHLDPNQVEVSSVCSLISSGTELKIFKGTFDDNAALDVNIQGMAEERMAYPLAYGYSLVGRVTRCGPSVKNADKLLGRLVFCFSPHASHAIVDIDALQVVPDGIDARDAVFMPSVETALSLVQDAHVRLGERIAVYGQGLIGLLVTSILSLQTKSIHSGRFGTVSTFDTFPDRLAASSDVGASQALLPSEASTAGPFDVSIEVSGNARALQSAIDCTISGGRIVIGSWYGNEDVPLKLGIDFHRSHKTIITSQVSELRAELTGLWTKRRRFDFTWELVKRLRPSRRLTTKTVTLDRAQEAYELLDKGKEIAVCFEYPQQ